MASINKPVLVSGEQDNITLPEITGFTVSPASIDSGSTAILAWDVKNAVSIDIDHGVGSVPVSGQTRVSPAYSTTYKLSVSNDAGTRIRFVTLYVEIKQTAAGNLVNVDPVTGRNAAVDLTWQDYCLSNQYQVQIARDPYFTLKMYDSGPMDVADSLYPAFSYPPGNLEAGHTYYWRVRVTQAATGQRILGQWSEPQSFTIESGYATRANAVSVQAFKPANGCAACPVTPISFSWSGYQDTTRYRFILAKDAQLQDIVVEALTPNTAYELSQSLEYDTGYFWQVMAIDPIPSNPSSVFTFHTESAPQSDKLQESSATAVTPLWAILIMVVGILLIIAAVITIAYARPKV
ncbi:MAG: hypothetical protein JXA01_01350 [Dehalococcoidia bacterium]|nr:hypothetical protein [Dehalococcoidia bacterium]